MCAVRKFAPRGQAGIQKLRRVCVWLRMCFVFLAQLLIKTLMSDGLRCSFAARTYVRVRMCVIDKLAISLILSLEVLVCIHHRYSAWVNITSLYVHTHYNTHTQLTHSHKSFDLTFIRLVATVYIAGWKSGKIFPISYPGILYQFMTFFMLIFECTYISLMNCIFMWFWQI